MPTTASTAPDFRPSVRRSMQPAKSRASASTGVMSLNCMPGLGKSGTLRITPSISWAVILEFMEFHRRTSVFLGLHFLNHATQFSQCNVLHLAHALTRHAEFLADFLERLLTAAVQPKTIP